jgi:hypothetical protein
MQTHLKLAIIAALFFVVTLSENDKSKAKRFIKKYWEKEEKHDDEVFLKHEKETKPKYKAEKKRKEKNHLGVPSFEQLFLQNLLSSLEHRSFRVPYVKVAQIVKTGQKNINYLNYLDASVPGETTKKVTAVRLSDFFREAKGNGNELLVTDNEGKQVFIDKNIGMKLAKIELERLYRKCERNTERDFIDLARNNPTNSGMANKVIKMMFNKIYSDKEANKMDELRKSFLRIEERMHIPTGFLFEQYRKGIISPTLPNGEKKKNFLLEDDSKKAKVASLYDDLDSMNLDIGEEQEIPESLLSILNNNMKDAAKEKEGSEETTSWKTYLFGK